VVDDTGAPRRSGARRTGCYLWFYQALAAIVVLVDPFSAPEWPSAVPVSASYFAGNALGVRQAQASERWVAPIDVESEHARVTAQPLCVLSKRASFGTLGQVVLYVHSRQGNELSVGYFVYWNVERPWGANLPTYTLLPSLAIDGAYTHFLFLLPGLQRALYGAGDVEGATVIYDVGADGKLRVKAAHADNEFHDPVRLEPDDLVTRDGRVALMTDVWSHQLGATGAAAHYEQGDADVTCFVGSTLRPMTPETARTFRLGSNSGPLRARPAWRAAATG
jgi:hypothetical protein